MNIGVFDSGIGGLTVLKAFVRELPNYTYKYFGDNANAPYGEKTVEEVTEELKSEILSLQRENYKATEKSKNT